MKTEITVAATFLTSLLEQHGQGQEDGQSDATSLSSQERQAFLLALQQALYEKFLEHWFPTTPEKGQAFRAIHINYKPGMNL